MQEGDGLPELMCVPCVLQVSRAFTFKQQCRRSNQTLRSFNDDIEKMTESDNSNIHGNYKNEESSSVDVPLSECNLEGEVLINDTKEEQYTSADDTVTDNLDSELVLDSLPSEMESDTFEEEIELSSLPSESQFSTVVDEDIQQHLTANVHNNNGEEEITEEIKLNKSKDFGDYFDELPDQSIEDSFGKTKLKF